ncbi:MAG TPA: sigma-70 family RNA polymerase sigma factor [Polyangiaceae bacterium]|nr:sigma-70 family RNA polymerase sigma factor [Polyangiaceae bacterium]
MPLRAIGLMSKRRAQVSLILVGGTNRREISDAELSRGLVSGEGWAINATWHRFAPIVLTLAERCLGSRSEAEDVTQEIFLGVFRRVRVLREPEKLRSFVYSFAVRALKSELRRRKVRAWLSFHAPEAIVDLSSRSLDMESRDLLRRFYALLDRLAPRDRLIFSLREVESMTVDEIAGTMEVSLSTVKRSLRHAEARLSGWIKADPELASALDTERWVR